MACLVDDDRRVGHVQRGEPAGDGGEGPKVAHQGRDERDEERDDERDDAERLHPLVQVAEEGLAHDP